MNSRETNAARQRQRLLWRSGFFALFVLAPPLDLFRYDLSLGHFILFGQAWTLGIDAFRAGTIGAGEAALNLILRGLLPLLLLGGLLIGLSWRYGRLYCGWLCPHFSVVEVINGLMRRSIGRPTLWEQHAAPDTRPDRRWWPLTLLAVIGFAFLWALSLLTYLMPPLAVYGDLLDGTLGPKQTLFLGIATIVLSLEFLFARHLFCRFGCAVGLFQSLAWMANRKALVVGFDSSKRRECIDCHAACDHACPMRLKPRAIKRRMFTCTQCTRCLSACDETQQGRGRQPLLKWLDADCARLVSEHDFGHKPDLGDNCFDRSTNAAPIPEHDNPERPT